MIINSDDKIYLTYLKKDALPFDRRKIEVQIGNIKSFLNKPDYAWWGSPINAEFGWKEWCFCEEFHIEDYDWHNPIKWKLAPNTKILTIDWEDILQNDKSILDRYSIKPHENLPITFRNSPIGLDYNKLYSDGIYAIELLDGNIGHCFRNSYEFMFNSWDCESIVVLDKTKIEILGGLKNENT